MQLWKCWEDSIIKPHANRTFSVSINTSFTNELSEWTLFFYPRDKGAKHLMYNIICELLLEDKQPHLSGFINVVVEIKAVSGFSGQNKNSHKWVTYEKVAVLFSLLLILSGSPCLNEYGCKLRRTYLFEVRLFTGQEEDTAKRDKKSWVWRLNQLWWGLDSTVWRIIRTVRSRDGNREPGL